MQGSRTTFCMSFSFPILSSLGYSSAMRIIQTTLQAQTVKSIVYGQPYGINHKQPVVVSQSNQMSSQAVIEE